MREQRRLPADSPAQSIPGRDGETDSASDLLRVHLMCSPLVPSAVLGSWGLSLHAWGSIQVLFEGHQHPLSAKLVLLPRCPCHSPPWQPLGLPEVCPVWHMRSYGQKTTQTIVRGITEIFWLLYVPSESMNPSEVYVMLSRRPSSC